MILYLQKIIKSQRKLYLIILFILTILSALEFVLLGIYSSFTDLSNLYFIILRLISAIAIFISFFLTLMINNYFIENKYEEFSIILLSGCRTKNIIEYIVLQFGMLFVLADIMGFAVGYILMFMINHIQSYYFNYSIVTIAFSYAGILLCKMIYVFMINFGKFIRIKLNIADYITRHTSLTSQKQYFSGRLLANQTHQFPLGGCHGGSGTGTADEPASPDRKGLHGAVLQAEEKRRLYHAESSALVLPDEPGNRGCESLRCGGNHELCHRMAGEHGRRQCFLDGNAGARLPSVERGKRRQSQRPLSD